jgi:hypothetical protein
MNTIFSYLSSNFGKLVSKNARLLLFILVIVLFVLCAGAPGAMGGIGG